MIVQFYDEREQAVMKKRIPIKRVSIIILSFLVIITAIAAYLIYSGSILLNNPSNMDYPVRGVDVSSYQGEIDWDILSGQNIHFAFIKATEGSSFVDRNFKYNYENAQKTDLRIGAYHFFSFDSSGETQAENFINIVPITASQLPPVVDFEFYGDKSNNLPDKEATRKELDLLLNILENHYGKKPIIYATEKSYDLYLAGHYTSYDIWIRNVIKKPKELQHQDWVFWQYTNRERLDGYIGREKYIDMNVFNGTLEEFERYAK